MGSTDRRAWVSAIMRCYGYCGTMPSDGLRCVDSIDRVVSPHKIRPSSITALLDLNGGDVRSAQAHSRHKNLSTLIRYDDRRQQLQGKAAKTLADAILEWDVD